MPQQPQDVSLYPGLRYHAVHQALTEALRASVHVLHHLAAAEEKALVAEAQVLHAKLKAQHDAHVKAIEDPALRASVAAVTMAVESAHDCDVDDDDELAEEHVE